MNITDRMNEQKYLKLCYFVPYQVENHLLIKFIGSFNLFCHFWLDSILTR